MEAFGICLFCFNRPDFFQQVSDHGSRQTCEEKKGLFYAVSLGMSRTWRVSTNRSLRKGGTSTRGQALARRRHDWERLAQI